MTTGTTGTGAAPDTGIPRGGFGMDTQLQLSPRGDYALHGAPYQDFSLQVRRLANSDSNRPRYLLS